MERIFFKCWQWKMANEELLQRQMDAAQKYIQSKFNRTVTSIDFGYIDDDYVNDKFSIGFTLETLSQDKFEITYPYPHYEKGGIQKINIK